MDLDTMIALMAASIYPSIVATALAARAVTTDDLSARAAVRVARTIWAEVLKS